MDSNILAAIIGLFGGITVAIIGLIPLFRKSQRDKERADVLLVNIEAMERMIDSSIDLYERYKASYEQSAENEKILAEQNEENRKRINYLEKQIGVLIRGIEILIEQVLFFGGEPAFVVPEINGKIKKQK